MHKMMELKESLCDELNEYAAKRSFSFDDLDVIDKLTHSIKSIETILAMEGYSYDDGPSYSYNRRRDSMGRYSRDMGYSNDGHGKEAVAMELREAMDKAGTEKEREAISACMKELGL